MRCEGGEVRDEEGEVRDEGEGLREEGLYGGGITGRRDYKEEGSGRKGE